MIRFVVGWEREERAGRNELLAPKQAIRSSHRFAIAWQMRAPASSGHAMRHNDPGTAAAAVPLSSFRNPLCLDKAPSFLSFESTAPSGSLSVELFTVQGVGGSRQAAG